MFSLIINLILLFKTWKLQENNLKRILYILKNLLLYFLNFIK